jgi:sigma-B regulation protein RsbU (phosphoserine phosphatase)
MRETARFGPYEKAYVRKNGGLVPVLLNGCLVEGADGKEYIWQIVEDISGRKAAERAIAEARAYEREIETRIEETLLRGRPPAHLEGVEIAAVTVPNQHMDGDFAEFIPLNPQCFDVLVGDVMGKGIFAALVSAGAKSRFLHALSSQLAHARGGDYPTPAALVGAVHRDITRQLIDLDCFLTLSYARFDLAAGRVVYVDCGHTKTIRYRPAENTWAFLQGDNVPIGFLEAETYVEHEVEMQPGDLFVFYSDGLTETRDPEGAFFGVERLQQAIQLHASLEPSALTRKIVERVAQFSGMETPGDDQTCVAVKIMDTGEAEGNATARLSIPASADRLVAARTFLQEHLAAHAALLGGQDDFSRIVLAFVEALSNIIKHSFDSVAKGGIEIELRSSRNRLSIEIIHDGAPFRPRSTPLPDPTQRREGGYGLYIMNRCFDRIAYETTRSGAQSILLIKHFSPGWQPSPSGAPGGPVAN